MKMNNKIKTIATWVIIVISLGLLIVGFSSCKRMNADYTERKAGVSAVCNTCTFVMSENIYYAVDTSKQPNIIYMVTFRFGGWFYKASDVDDLIRIN